MSVIEKAIKLRSDLRMSQKEFGDAIGISQPMVSLCELGRNSYSIAALKKMLKLSVSKKVKFKLRLGDLK